MKIIIDASTLLNLANGGVLLSALALPNREFLVSAEVRRESRTIAREIDRLAANGALKFVDATTIDADTIENSMLAWDLGAGECECILAAHRNGAAVACDDNKARNRILLELGADRQTGSIGILKTLVEAGILTSTQASDAYHLMKNAGGFLPALPENHFG